MNQTAKILGVKIDIVSWDQIDQFCKNSLIQAAPKMITTVNGEIILAASKSPEYKTVLNGASLAIADSTNVVWIGRLKGYKFDKPTPGSELLWRICQIAEELKKSVYFLGGRDGAAEATAKIISEKYPNLEVAGYSEADPEDENIAKEIRRKNPDVVFVAYGAPKQELWINKNKDIVTAKIMVGIGGTFDMVSGKFPRAPLWMRSMHLEWLWRFLLQPKRIFRIFKAVVVFPLKALFSR